MEAEVYREETQAPDIGKLAEALALFQGEMPKIELDATVKVKMKSGGAYTFEYATLQNIMRKALPVLTKHGLSISQTFNGPHLQTTLLHKSGQTIKSVVPIDISSGSMQEIGSRISYMRRYQLSPLLGIVADADDDANIAAGNTYQKQGRQSNKKAETKKETPPAPFADMLTKFATAKGVLNKKTGDDSIYYSGLETLGFKHANEIKKVSDGNKLLAEFRTFLTPKKEEKAAEVLNKPFPPEDIPY